MLQTTRLLLVLNTARHFAWGLRLNSSGHGSEDVCITSPWEECSSEDDGLLLSIRHGGTTQAETSISMNCPLFKNPEVGALTATMKSGPVHIPHGRPSTDSDNAHTYLFVLAAPHTSSTGLLSLLATSPRASTLCSGGTHACEGTWILEQAGMLTRDNRWQPDIPRDWNAALDVYAEWWNSSQRVFIDKSPPNIVKAERILSQLSQSGKHVKFIIMTRSPCYKGSWMGWPQHDDEWYEQMSALMDDASNLPPASYLHLRHEDLLRDPYGQTGRILEFLPELRSLDPAKNGLVTSMCAPACNSLVDYVIDHAPFRNSQKKVEGFWPLGYAQMFGHI